MADSDDDLVVPPKAAPKPAITLDDSDDDLPAPKPAAPAAPPAPSSTNKVVLDDSDDDLLPAPPGNNAAASPRADNSGSPTTSRPPAASLPPASSKQSFKDPNSAAPRSMSKAEPGSPASPKAAAAGGGGGNDEDELAATLRRQRTYRRKKLHKEGFLFKQQPVWPYGTQKRWCVLDGRLFNYYDTQGAVKPSAILDLKGATVVLDSEEAKQPNSFGISNITSGTSGTGASGALKGRVFIFSALNKEEMNEWVEAIRSVTAEPQSEVHWFEKMAQGSF